MTPLALRPLDIRLKVAYLADAFNSYAPTEPGNTLSRAYSSLDGTHPYVAMWHSIGNFYTKQEWTELSDAELKEELIVAFRLGYTHKATGAIRNAEDILKCVQKWRDCGWFRYEQHRDGRRTNVYRWAPLGVSVAILLTTGAWVDTSA